MHINAKDNCIYIVTILGVASKYCGYGQIDGITACPPAVWRAQAGIQAIYLF